MQGAYGKVLAHRLSGPGWRPQGSSLGTTQQAQAWGLSRHLSRPAVSFMCVRAGVFVHTHVCVCMSLHVSTHTCTRLCASVCVCCVHAYVCIHVCLCVLHVICEYLYISMDTHVSV